MGRLNKNIEMPHMRSQLLRRLKDGVAKPEETRGRPAKIARPKCNDKAVGIPKTQKPETTQGRTLYVDGSTCAGSLELIYDRFGFRPKKTNPAIMMIFDYHLFNMTLLLCHLYYLTIEKMLSSPP